MPYSPGSIVVNPNGQTAVVTFTLPGGGTPIAYNSISGSGTISLPATITVPTRFYFAELTQITVSALVGAAQVATSAGTTASVDLSGGGQATLTCAVPSTSGSGTSVASGVAFTPVGTLAGTDVQTALAEAASEAAQKAANLSDLASAVTARANLGLGTAATQPSSAFDAAGAAATEQTRALAAEALLAPLVRAATTAYAATVTPNADTTDVLNIGTLTGNITLANPTGTPRDGQQIRVRLTQDATGGRTITLGTAYRLPAADSIPTAASSLVELGIEWNAGLSKWAVLAIKNYT